MKLANLSMLGISVLAGSLVACAADDVPIGSSERLALNGERCPPVALPAECPKGQVLTTRTNESGCEQVECSSGTPAPVCPPVAQPPADWCGPGKTPALGKDPRGCDAWTCPSTAPTCPPVAQPPADWCGPGKTPALGKDPKGCDAWTCPTNASDPCSTVKCDSGSTCQLCPAPGKLVPSCVPTGAAC